jgi:cytochrome-b5 reductase
MLAAGTGITPMIQSLWQVLGTSEDDRKVVLLYGSETADSILMRTQLEEWACALPHRFTLVHVLGKQPNQPPPSKWRTCEGYVAESGWIDRAKIEKYAFPPAKDTLVLVCGPRDMYDALCGPREDDSLCEGTVLDKLGYTPAMIAKM